MSRLEIQSMAQTPNSFSDVTNQIWTYTSFQMEISILKQRREVYWLYMCNQYTWIPKLVRKISMNFNGSISFNEMSMFPLNPSILLWCVGNTSLVNNAKLLRKDAQVSWKNSIPLSVLMVLIVLENWFWTYKMKFLSWSGTCILFRSKYTQGDLVWSPRIIRK